MGLEPPTPPPPEPTLVELTQATATFGALGDTMTIRAVVRDQFGAALPDLDTVWITDDAEDPGRTDAIPRT